MTATGITAGRERYYRRDIALGDGARGVEATVSSTVPGVPPGVWHGQAADRLGLSGVVSDEQMKALFGLGMHPDAQVLVARELEQGASLKRAMRAGKLGPAVPRLAELSPLDREIQQVLDQVSEQLCRPLTKAETRQVRQKTAAHAFTAEYHRAPADGAELGRFLSARSGPQRRAVTGYDLTFSSEELSLLFALAGPQVRRTVLEVMAEARAETVVWLEQHALAVRTGPGGVTQQQAVPGLLATVYLHYESRAGDPMLHEHVVISPRVQGPDGRWRNLDSRLLLREVVAASELFNQRALELICDRLGLATQEVEVTPGQRPVMQIVGINRRIRAVFAQRADAVRGMAEALFDDYRRRHGRQPERPARLKLQWQATAMTRPRKRRARSLDELLAAWRRRAIAVTSPDVVDHLLATAQAAARNRPAPAAFDLGAAAEQVLAAVAERRTTFRRRHVLAEARRYLMRTLAGATAPPQAAEDITDRVLAHADCLDITPPAINPSHPDLQRADGTSIYRPIGSATYTTHSLLAAENRLLAAARRDVIPPVGRSAFHRAAALHRGPMDAGQRALAASFALSDKLLLAGLGPAGAGKTTAMKLVASAVDAAGGRLIPLAPSSRAAKVLADDLGRRAHTLHSWLHHRGRATDGKPVEADFRLRPGDMVLVDEAGMAGTLLLGEVLGDAAAAGAVVRLLGDPHQLAAVEAGGALRLISRAGGTVELDQLHRFRTAGEADASLILRDGDDPRAAFDWYRERGRIVAGHHEAMCDAVFTAWAHDLNKGLTSLMTAADTATVTALNRRAQTFHIEQGTVDTSRTVTLRAGQHAHVGDIIVTRLNRRRMTVRGGRDFVKNGDTWTLTKILPGGDAIVRHTHHRGRIRLPADYVAAQCELGYASTIHRAQGMTVDTSHALASARSGREGVYVQLTRGARTNRLYVALDDGDRLDDVLAAIAARRRAQLSATESIAALQRESAAPGRLSAEFADVAERATTARLTGLIEHALGADRAAMFMAADAYPALVRALHGAERAGFDLPRLLAGTVPARGFTDADDPAAVLTWRLRRRMTDAADAQRQADPDRPLAALTLAQLHTLTRLAASHRAVAREGLKAADAAFTHLPGPVTSRAGHTYPAFDQRPMGDLSRHELATQLSTVRAQMRHAQANRIPLSSAARHLIAALTRESQLRRALTWRDAAREDYQRERATNTTAPGAASTAAVRRSLAARRATTAQRRRFARAALARADAVSGKIHAELRLRERLPDHAPHRPNHRGEIPDWVADRHALVHLGTPAHWRTHLAERHRILARLLADRGHTLAAHPPAWARPLGPPPPATAPRRRHAWATTAALVELWRTRHAISSTPGLGPRPDTPDDAAAWDDLDARVRALTGRRRPLHLPPPDAPASVMIAAALDHLDAPPPAGPLPDHPALRDPFGVAPLSYGALDARTARHALAAVLAGESLPEPWMEEITAPGVDDEDEDEQRTYTKLLTAIGDYRRRHHRAGPDILGPRPAGLDGEEWDHLTDAIDLYTHARIEHRLEQMRARTAAERAALLPPTSPLRQHPPEPHRPGHRPPAR